MEIYSINVLNQMGYDLLVFRYHHGNYYKFLSTITLAQQVVESRFTSRWVFVDINQFFLIKVANAIEFQSDEIVLVQKYLYIEKHSQENGSSNILKIAQLVYSKLNVSSYIHIKTSIINMSIVNRQLTKIKIGSSKTSKKQVYS